MTWPKTMTADGKWIGTYVGCPHCGFVTTAETDGPNDDFLPWCLHHNRNTMWRSGGPESGWTPMVRVRVEDDG